MIYLDNSATTPLAAEAINAIKAALPLFANPSSTHTPGREAAKAVAAAREVIAKSIGADKDEVYFTSGGTESDNIAVFGMANKKRGKRVVTTAIEHPAVARAMDVLENDGFEVVRLMPDCFGNISPQAIENAVTEDTSLVSIMHVNNETGAIMPIDKIGAAIKRIAPRAFFHTDAVQSFGHIPFTPKKWGVDAASISSHKIHGPKGIGALYLAHGAVIHSPVCGGGQEKGLRSGTHNTIGILGFAAAVGAIDLSHASAAEELKARLAEGIGAIGGAYINGGENSSPYILNMSLEGIPGEVLLNALDLRGICISAGSACAAASKAPSGTLLAMGAAHPKEAVRFSLSRYTSRAEIDETINAVSEIAAVYRRK